MFMTRNDLCGDCRNLKMGDEINAVTFSEFIQTCLESRGLLNHAQQKLEPFRHPIDFMTVCSIISTRLESRGGCGFCIERFKTGAQTCKL